MFSQNSLDTLDRQGVEWPDSYNRDELVESVLLVKPLLEGALNVPFELDASAQDATFTCNLGSLQDDSGIRRQNYSVCFTFSNFGKLCLVWGEQEWLVRHETAVKAAETILAGHGFIPVRTHEVGGLYNGDHAEWIGMTWLARFFAHY